MKRKFFSILFALVLVLSLGLDTAVPVAANTVSSSTMIFEGQLTHNGDGTYSGVIPMVDESVGPIGDEEAGYDVYAEEGASAWFGEDPGSGPVWTPQEIVDHDAWPEATWDPDTPDWYQYSLELYVEDGAQKWAIRNHPGATAAHPWYDTDYWGSEKPPMGVPMSGFLDWTAMYAAETDVGAYLPSTGTAKIPGGAATYGGGPACWDMDWSWGSEVVPLQYPGFDVVVSDLGGGDYRVTLVPAAPSYGMITGGGWIDSPWNAMAPSMVGDAFFNGFETDTAGWFDWGGSITRVASGTNGVPSADGNWHAEVVVGPSNGDGVFTKFGGYSSVFPAGGFSQIVDVYIDPVMGTSGNGWALDNALNGSDGNWKEAGGVGALKAEDGNWWLAADGDGGGYPGPASGGVGLKVDMAGWYTIESQWVENASDSTKIDRNTFIYDSLGTLLYNNINLQQVDLANAGGHRYGWFLDANGPDWPPIQFALPIDNSRLVQLIGPTGKATFGLVSRYKKGANVPTGQTEFIFKAGGLNFHSSSYDWLVVNQDGNNAQFKGWGTVNGEDGYRFMLWAGDKDPDTFRIKIWQEENGVESVLYDNKMNQPIGGGNIVIHKK